MRVKNIQKHQNLSMYLILLQPVVVSIPTTNLILFSMSYPLCTYIGNFHVTLPKTRWYHKELHMNKYCSVYVLCVQDVRFQIIMLFQAAQFPIRLSIQCYTV